jgi:hypothetical protein
MADEDAVPEEMIEHLGEVSRRVRVSHAASMTLATKNGRRLEGFLRSCVVVF